MEPEDVQQLLGLLKQSDEQALKSQSESLQSLMDATDRQIAQIAAYKAIEDGSPDAGLPEIVAALSEGADPT